jgi:hypothetical protein
MVYNLSDWEYLWERHRGEYVLLQTREGAKDSLEGCLIFSLSDRSKLIIEDDSLAMEIMQRMQSNGVPILTRDELPPGESLPQRTIAETYRAGKTAREINEALKKIRHRER